LLGWDAADWQMIDPLLAQGLMPNLARLLANGTRAELRTLEPKLSPILWSTIATGKTADKHGILNFVEPNPSGEGIRVSASTTRRTRALWNILTLRGLRTHAVGWYASHPAEPINGTCVSNLLCEGAPAAAGEAWPLMQGVVQSKQDQESVESRIATARIAPSAVSREALREVLPLLSDASQRDKRPGTLAKELSRAMSLHGAAVEALRGGAWDCAMVFHDTIDTIGHHFMEYRAPQMSHISAADMRLYGEVMDRTYRLHDRMLGELLGACGEGTTVILVSDHGFHSGAERPVILDVTKEERAALESRWHRTFGVAVFSGPGFRAGNTIAAPTLLDIAPTALAALGLPMGKDMDGRVVAEAFETAPQAGTIESWDSETGDAGEHPAEMRHDPFEAADALRQLIELGYMPDVGEDQRRMVELTRRESRYNLAMALMTTGRAAQAVPVIESLLAECPDVTRYISALAQCLQASNEHQRALGAIDAWERAAPNVPEPALSRIVSLMACGETAKANTSLDAAIKSYGSASNLARTLADLLGRAGRWDESAPFAKRAAQHDPGAPEAHLACARAALERGEYEAAVEHCLDATERVMALPEAHYMLGAALAWGGGELDQAAQCFAIALKLMPGYPEALAFAAEIAEVQKRTADAQALRAELGKADASTSPFPTTRGAAAWRASRKS
jgi:tetratricopeptide (TPR) repeat protein